MRKIHSAVSAIVHRDEVALSALVGGYMNLSQYAKRIQAEVEVLTKKEVGHPGIVVALSRLRKTLRTEDPLVQDVEIQNITTKAPLSEMVYAKNAESIAKLAQVYASVRTGTGDFFTLTLSTNEITVICSDRIKKEIEKTLKKKPVMVVNNLASVGLSLDPEYYPRPNITFSLIRRIALKRIPLAETITTHTEIIFVFDQRYLAEIVDLYIDKKDC